MVGVAGAVEDAGDGVADGGEQAGGLPGAQPGGVFAEGDVAPVMQTVLYSPVAAVAVEQEFRAGLGGGERGDGQDGLAGQFRAVRGGAGGEAEVVAVAVSGGCAAGGRGVAAADVVPVPFDERELGCSGQLAADQLRDVAGDPDGADLVPGRDRSQRSRAGWARVPRSARRLRRTCRLVVLEDQDPADVHGVHRLDVPGLGVHRIRRHDDQLPFPFPAAAAAVVAVAVAGVAGVSEDCFQEGDEAGDLVGFPVDVCLAEDGAFGDVVGGQQVGLCAVGPEGAADGLAVDGDVPPVQPAGGGLGAQPGAQLLISGRGIDGADRPLDRLEARRDVPAEPRVVPDAAAAQRLLRHRLRELGGGVDPVRARQPGDNHHRQDRCQAVPDPLRLAVVADPAKVVQQPAVPVGFQLVEVRCPPPGQHRRVEPGLQRRRAARHQLSQPVRLRLPVTGVMRGAAAAPVPGGLPGRGEPARLVHRPRVRRRVGERLHRHQP